MKKVLIGLVCCAVLGIAFSFMGVSSVSAAPADPQKGTGCFASGDGANYFFDSNCSSHYDFKFNDDGSLQFFIYQDQTQLPAEVARPARGLHSSFEQCYNFSFGQVCGT